MPSGKRRTPGLLTLREAATRLGVPDAVVMELLYLHPPVLEFTLVGRAPRLRLDQVKALHERLVGLIMELVRHNPSLLGTALTLARAPAQTIPERSLREPDFLRLIEREASSLFGSPDGANAVRSADAHRRAG